MNFPAKTCSGINISTFLWCLVNGELFAVNLFPRTCSARNFHCFKKYGELFAVNFLCGGVPSFDLFPRRKAYGELSCG
jgi:hypothetical protein